MFSEDEKEVKKVLEETSSGTVCVNDTALQIASPLPFGGVGASGFGSYKGKRSFETFSHEKRVLWRSPGMEFINKALRYPPFTSVRVGRLLRLMAYEPQESEISTGRYYNGIFKIFSFLYNVFLRPFRQQQRSLPQ